LKLVHDPRAKASHHDHRQDQPRHPPLDPAAAEPYYRQIYERFRSAIASGLLKPGDRIPSARALTKELGLARGTIETAYSLLAAEGYIQARGQAGTIVTPGLKPRTPVARPALIARGRPRRSFRPDSILPFQMGLPALDEFPPEDLGPAGRALRARDAAADMTHPSVYGRRCCARRSPPTCRCRAASTARRRRCS
jgi:GntR family transcriptional regulator/MocR family aminotransferase